MVENVPSFDCLSELKLSVDGCGTCDVDNSQYETEKVVVCIVDERDLLLF